MDQFVADRSAIIPSLGGVIRSTLALSELVGCMGDRACVATQFWGGSASLALVRQKTLHHTSIWHSHSPSGTIGGNGTQNEKKGGHGPNRTGKTQPLNEFRCEQTVCIHKQYLSLCWTAWVVRVSHCWAARPPNCNRAGLAPGRSLIEVMRNQNGFTDARSASPRAPDSVAVIGDEGSRSKAPSPSESPWLQTKLKSKGRRRPKILPTRQPNLKSQLHILNSAILLNSYTNEWFAYRASAIKLLLLAYLPAAVVTFSESPVSKAQSKAEMWKKTPASFSFKPGFALSFGKCHLRYGRLYMKLDIEIYVILWSGYD